VIDATGRPQRVLLLGGSSEIGLAIVERLLARRAGHVVLAGRPSRRRDAAVERCRRGGHTVEVVDLDAAATDSHDRVLDEAFSHGDVDVAVVAVGVLGDQAALLGDPPAAARLATVNYVGAVSIGLGLAARLRTQGHGHVVALSSVAGELPRRANFVYGSSKAGFDAFFRGLADELAGTTVTASVVRPGFVHTRMTEGLRPAPFAVGPEQVAEAAAATLHHRRPVVWVPGVLRWVMTVLRHLPRQVVRRLPR
jgi:decaprenylphospho-beta-D-erythro-pentofuranosid-2-ulose 2-reductase